VGFRTSLPMMNLASKRIVQPLGQGHVPFIQVHVAPVRVSGLPHFGQCIRHPLTTSPPVGNRSPDSSSGPIPLIVPRPRATGTGSGHHDPMFTR